MSYEVILSDTFKKEVKKLIKKYPSLKSDLTDLNEQLSKNPTLGTSLGDNIYKIRLAITSKGKGKSGGARIISYAKVINQTVYLLSIYDKSQKSSISDKEIQELLKLYISET